MRRYRKGIAALLLLVFLQETFAPSISFALTGGPSQPEVESFEPVGTNQMVDLSSGDFNYNIPLMVVPGPNGGYPINLAYHAGIGMEQEASWVGLGWNINPGAITRNMRGVPDDFSGDQIQKTVSMKSDVTVGVGIPLAALSGSPYNEVAGFQTGGGSGHFQLYYNNYRGVGYTISSSPLVGTIGFCSLENKAVNGIQGSLMLSFDSQTGLGVMANIGIGKYVQGENAKWSGRSSYSVGVGLHSRQGMQSLSFEKDRKSGRSWAGISFVNHTYVPATNNSINGWNFKGSLTIKKPEFIFKFGKAKAINVDVLVNNISEETRNMSTYGTMYLENQAALDGSGQAYDRVVDVNLNNSTPISKNSVHLGVPVMTSDVYSISGQGVGGSFRTHRNDIGKLYEPGNVSNNHTISAGLEIGTSTGVYNDFRLGIDLGYGYHKSYSGKWTDGMDHLSALTFQEKNTMVPLYEPFYFKVAGEQVAIQTNEWSYMDYEDPVAFDLGLKWETISPKPIVKSNLINSSQTLSQRPSSAERMKRIQNVEYRTKVEVEHGDFYSSRQEHLYSSGTIPDGSNGDQINYGAMGDDNFENGDHHIHEYSILSPDGTRYTYGLPAYNEKQIERVFSNTTGVSAYTDLDLNTYAAADATTSNDEGVDHYFSETEIPAYVHSHLITQITSADYVDLTDDGPTEDDFGFYTKFNYVKVDNYQWREPFFDANYIKGYYSNEADDKAAYSYGVKDLYYVQSIETKTHIAVFYLGDRNDGKGAYQENNLEDEFGASQKYLQKIVLYSKNDAAYPSGSMVPLQTVFFQYSYELCQGIYNNDGLVMDNTAHFVDTDDNDVVNVNDNDGGKLTLKRVYITYNGNEKGRLSPYEFEYGNNETYAKLDVDRWGNYQEAASAFENGINPYTRQDLDEATHNSNASAWCMNQIILPSGGEINIEYESDTYGYVQDQRAMQMCEIVGFTETDVTTVPIGSAERYKMTKNNLRLWFKMNETVDGTSQPTVKEDMVADYVSGIDEIYFKVFQYLAPNQEGEFPKDYVVGYAKIDNESFGYSTGDDAYAYVDLLAVNYKSAVGLTNFETHPFRKAGWQYVRHQRPDIFYNQTDADNTLGGNVVDNIYAIASSMNGAITDALSIVGYYNKAALLGYCKYMDPTKRSFVRLNCPDYLKYGGGHRVKTLSVADDWTEGAREFGTEYEYTNSTGQTSGVADYEPMVGGEENCLKNPIWYNGNDTELNFQHIDAYLETPLNESVYPGPRIVYGRVIQKNLENADVKLAQSGITVSEFYTAKDFPVYEENTELEAKGFNLPLYIPFVGLQTFQNNGYSQGYSVVLNDMSGRPKSNATYPYRSGEVSGQPVSKVEYIYQTDSPGRLNNEVTVLDDHGVTRKATMGVEQDFMIYEEQDHNFTLSAGGEFNVHVISSVSPPGILPLPTFMGNLNYAESMYRGVTTNKIIYKTGILSEVKAYSDGSLVTTQNLLYDAETGEALLTKVNNEWDKPVYNYNYAAHWAYNGMDGAYKNYRAQFNVNGSAGALKLSVTVPLVGSVDLPVQNYLEPGDEIQFLESGEFVTYYVTVVDAVNNDFTLENAAGTPISFSNEIGTIMRSGHRNHQSVKSGNVISLTTDFLSATSNAYSQQFMLFNSTVSGGDPNMGQTDPSYIDLDDLSEQTYTWNFANYKIPNYYDCNATPGDMFNLLTVQAVPRGEPVTAVDIEFSIGDCRHKLVFTDMDTPFELGYIFPVASGGITSYAEQFVNFKIIGETMSGSVTSTVQLMYLPTGEIFNAAWTNSPSGAPSSGCFQSCPGPGVLHADATVFSDDWGGSYPYIDVCDPSSLTTALSDGTVNEFRYGQLGIWRPKMTYLYQVVREQNGTASDFLSKINIDGMYESWVPFNWQSGAANPNWDWVTEITRYSPYGFALEELSRLSTDLSNGDPVSIYNCQLYAFDNSLVVATSGNASYFEMGYDGFEEYYSTSDYEPRGHLNLTLPSSGVGKISTTKAHTGSRSVSLTNGQTAVFTVNNWDPGSQLLQGIEGKEYIVSLWVNVESGGVGTLSDGVNTVDTEDTGEIIDGWKKLELKVTMPTSPADLTITYTSTGSTYIDDLRFGPYNGGMMTYVFDPHRLWLLAELDALNYATFYNYDSEGKLVQVKKETERGIITIQTSRSNTKQLP